MKKVLALLLAMTMMLGLVACDSSNNDAASSDTGSGYEDTMNSGDDNASGDESLPTDDDVTADDTDSENKDTQDEQIPEEDNKPAENQKPVVEEKPAVDEKPAANEKPVEEQKPTEEQKPADSAKNYSGSLTDLIDGIYAIQPLEMMLGSMPLDLTDLDGLNYFTGLSDASLIKEAVVSEPMIGSIAYSMIVIRASSANDAATLAQNMYDNINQSKWICVTAHNLAVGTYGDVVMLVMCHNDLGADMHLTLRDAFASVCGGTLDNTKDRVVADGAPEDGIALG